MLTLPGHEVRTLLHESEYSLVFRGRRTADDQPVVLKTVRASVPDPEYLARYQQEYTLTQALTTVPGVIGVYSLEQVEHRPVLVLEDYGGQPLGAYLGGKPLAIAPFLDIAIALTRILGQVHAAHIIHKDINPANILIHAQTGEIRLIDFGIASRLSRETPAVSGAGILEGTLAYLSPEQTGRMNRTLDYRSDFYSLGATFYQMLTGQPPFATKDVLELVHCHIAREPVPPHLVTPTVPEGLSAIVLKLLAKTAEERYQSPWGLEADLRRCQDAWSQTGAIAPFPLGTQDIADRFQIPQTLYGRSAEVATILQAFGRIAEADPALPGVLAPRELLRVAGYSGIGKSRLVREVYKPLTRCRGYLMAGKFDPLQRNIPYRAFIDAFSDLVSQLLTEPEAQLAAWRSHLHQALGGNLAVMVSLVPNLALIVGDQPSPPTLSGTEAQNRFNLAIQTFVRVFAQPSHPLVLFLDDLQWADSASLGLMQRLLTEPEGHSLLLIAAYRDNEVGPMHPFRLTLERVQAAGAPVTAVELQPLAFGDINQLVAETVHRDPAETTALATLVQQKTGGNPFFMGEFLKALHRDGLITFDRQRGRWDWDLEKIQTQGITDNVVTLLATSLQTLPEASQRSLQYAACMGMPFDLHSLAQVLQQSVEATADQLWPALEAELVLPLGETYRLATVAAVCDRPLYYRFAHDRIQQAAYSLLPEAERPAVHRLVGQRLLEIATRTLETSQLFQIVNQLNLGQTLTTSPAERLILAGLNLRAGRQAKAAAAYDTALTYLQAGLAALGDEAWSEQPRLTADLHQEAAEVACLCGEYGLMTQLLSTAIAHTPALVDQVPLHLIQVQATILQNQPRQAVEQTLPLLRRLGVAFPNRAYLLFTIAGLMRAQVRLARWSDAALRSHPAVTDPHSQAVMDLLEKIGTPAYVAMPDLSPLLTFKILQRSLRYGYAKPTAMAFVAYGLVMAAIVNNIDAGDRYGRIGLAVADRFQSPLIRCRSRFLFTYLISHWKRPLRSLSEDLAEVYQLGLEAGDLEYAAYGLYTAVQVKLLVGDALPALAQQFEEVAEVVDRLQQQTARQWVRMNQQLITCLRQADPTQPEVVLDIPQETSDRTGHFLGHSCRMLLHYLFDRPDQALIEAEAARPYWDSATGAPSMPLHRLIQSLSQAAHSPQANPRQRQRWRREMQQTAKQFKLWAQHAPENYAPGHALIQGAIAAAKGQSAPALRHFQQAIALAQTHRRLLEEALAHERMGHLYLRLDQPVAASGHLTRAHFCYQIWGADAKAEHLRRQHPNLIASSSDGAGVRNALAITHQTTSSTSGRMSESLDFSSVMKASEAIAGEIVLDKLLGRLMQILIESAGAQAGVLLLDRDGDLRVEAVGSTAAGTTQVLQGQAVAESPYLPGAIVNYVMRTQASLVLGDARLDGRFAQDPYMQSHQPKSVLCAPLKNQGRLSGLVYLENNLTPNAFTPDRLEVLNLLSSQAAIALDNARLYTNLADLNTAYARFVPRQFLQHLDKRSIIEVNLGDQVQIEMSVMFSDIRAFTTLSEAMTPEENFRFINDYLACMEPVIVEHGGFIDKYIGDAIMALFSSRPDDAVRGGIAMQQALTVYNQQRQQGGDPPIQIGIGINTGSLMLGTVGGPNRMDSTVISDAVNLAARLEDLTKTYNASLLISQYTYTQMHYPEQYRIRKIGNVSVKGKLQPVTIYEVFDADPPEMQASKEATLDAFHQAVDDYDRGNWQGAIAGFMTCLTHEPGDGVALHYLACCRKALTAAEKGTY